MKLLHILIFLFIISTVIYFICNTKKPTNFISLQKYPEMDILVQNHDIILSELNYVLKNSLWTNYDNLHKKNIFQESTNEEIQLKLQNSISKISTNTSTPSWKIYGLLLNKEEIENNCSITKQLLQSIPYVINAGFSCLEAGKITDYHSDNNLNYYRYQLPLIVPDGDAKFRLVNEIIEYVPNEPFIFDDSKLHQAWNLTNGIRIVLIVDILKMK